jgi:hypothetical protein
VKNIKSDLGEIIRNHIYVREIYAICYEEQERYLFLSEDLFKKLTRLHDYLGVRQSQIDEIKVRIKLPLNPNPKFRDQWQVTNVKKSVESPLVLEIDRFNRYFKNEVVLASSTWMGYFETFPGDRVVISCCAPVLAHIREPNTRFSSMEVTN